MSLWDSVHGLLRYYLRRLAVQVVAGKTLELLVAEDPQGDVVVVELCARGSFRWHVDVWMRVSVDAVVEALGRFHCCESKLKVEGCKRDRRKSKLR